MGNANSVSDLERAEHASSVLAKRVTSVNTVGSTINPATEEKQDAIILSLAPAQVLYDKTSGSLDYKGVNTSPTAAQSDTTWKITKYVRSSGSLTQKIIQTGSWTGRVALF